MDPTLPKIVPTHSNQILIHPEHAAGKLNVPSSGQTKLPNFFRLKTLTLFTTLALVVVFIFGFFALPKVRTVMFASNTETAVGELGSKTKEVNNALNVLYQSITASSAGEDSSLSEINSGVLSANTGAATNTFVGNSLLLFIKANTVLEQDNRVKGFSVPETDPNKAVREQRKLAENISVKTESAKELLSSEIKDLQKYNVDGKAGSLRHELVTLSGKTNDFLTESEKTSNYYVAISDAAIDIYNISNTISDVSDLDNSVADLTKLRNSFANYDKDKLPAEIGALNSDVVAIFDLLINFFKEVEGSSQNNPTKILGSLTNFINETKNLGVQTSTHELSFWQNNPSLSAYDELSVSYSSVISAASKVKAEHNYFLLPLLGVN